MHPAVRPITALWPPYMTTPLAANWRTKRLPRRRSSHALSHIDFASLLTRPTWSVRSLLAPVQESASGSDSDSPAITEAQLDHLLRLSALPSPKDAAEAATMISTLQSQLRFVRDIKSVCVTHVEPLRAIRDETDEGLAEATIGIDQLRKTLDEEIRFGRWKRPMRRKEKAHVLEAGGWDTMGTAQRRAGRYFIVRTGYGTTEG